jgi:hypothetical protein
MGSIAGPITAVSNLLDLGAATIVPGHGEVTGPEVIDDVLGYLHFVQAVARQGVDAALTPRGSATSDSTQTCSTLSESSAICIAPTRSSEASRSARTSTSWLRSPTWWSTTAVGHSRALHEAPA